MTLLEQLLSEDFTLTDLDGKYSRTIQHDSLVYDRENDLFYWNSQGIKGNAFWYLVKVRGMSGNGAKEYLAKHGQNIIYKEKIIPNEDHVDDSPIVQARLVNLFYEAGKNHREYWHDVRGYTDDTVTRFKLGYTGEWYTIPFFVDSYFKNFQARKLLPDGSKRIKNWYKGVGPLPFNFSVLKFTDWIVITEGPVDAIMLRQNSIPAVSHNAGSDYWNEEWNQYFSHIKKFFIVYDNDTAGNHGAVRLAKIWGGRASIYNFWDYPEKYDITDYFKDGGNSEDFINMLLAKGKAYYEVNTE